MHQEPRHNVLAKLDRPPLKKFKKNCPEDKSSVGRKERHLRVATVCHDPREADWKPVFDMTSLSIACVYLPGGELKRELLHRSDR